MDNFYKPMSEAWKATKRTLAELIDNNEGGRIPGSSGERSHSFDQNVKRDAELNCVASEGTRQGQGHTKVPSQESGLDRTVHTEDADIRPMDYDETASSSMTRTGKQCSTSSDSIDFAEVHTPASGSQATLQNAVPKIKSKDKAGADRDRTRNTWAKFRLGYFSKSFNSSEGDEEDRGPEKSPILPSRMDKTSPAYTSSSSVGSPGKSKSSSRSSRRSRGEIVPKNFDLRSRFRSNSSDRATMKRREREERERTRRSSYSRSTSFDANDEDINFNEAADDISDDQAEKVKMKLLSMWNNVKYGWTVKSKTSFSIHKPIWFLGKCYHQRPEDPDPVRPPGVDYIRSMVIEDFKQDFSSRLWLTYRREFPMLAGSTLTSDCGWGCMLRSGQMLLAHSLLLHFLGRDWTIYKNQTQETMHLHRQIIRWFGDQPLDMSPFSVHRLVSIGQTNGKKVGDWYGPASVAHILKEAMDTAHELNPLLGQLCVYVAQDCTVYKQDVIDLCRSRSTNVLQPVYKDVQAVTTAPIKCTKAPRQGKNGPPYVVHEQLQSSSVPSGRDSGPGGANGRCRVGARLAQSHEKMASSSYSGGPGSARSSSSAGSSTTTVGSSWHVVGTSTSSSLGTGSIGTGSYTQRSRSSDHGSDMSGQEASRSLPSRTNQHLHPGLPNTMVEESPASDLDTRMSQEQDIRNRMSAKQDIQNRMSAEQDIRNRMSPEQDIQNRMSAEQDIRNRMSAEQDIQNKMSPEQDIRNRMSPEQDMCGDFERVGSRDTHSDQRMLRTSVGDKSVDMKDLVSYDPDSDSEVFDFDQDLDRTLQQEVSHHALLPDRTEDGSSLSQQAQLASNPGSLSACLPCQENQSTGEPCESGRSSCSECLGSLPEPAQTGATGRATGATSGATNGDTSGATSGATAGATAGAANGATGGATGGAAAADRPWCATIILVPVRLGGDEVNPVYIRPIQSLFTLEGCLGIIGGKPKHSLYFVGFQEEKLIHLDPHYCQQVVDMRSRDFPLWSFHCMSPRKMSIGKMDPSCTVGFYVKTEQEFERLCVELPKVVSPLGSHATDYPMFIVREGRCGDWQNKNTNTNRPERYLRVRHVDESGKLIAPVKESEDFVLLDS